VHKTQQPGTSSQTLHGRMVLEGLPAFRYLLTTTLQRQAGDLSRHNAGSRGRPGNLSRHNAEVGRGFIPGITQAESARDRGRSGIYPGTTLVREVGRGFIPGTTQEESTRALAPEACFSDIRSKSGPFRRLFIRAEKPFKNDSGLEPLAKASSRSTPNNAAL